MRRLLIAGFVLVGLTAAVADSSYDWNLPRGFPVPRVPADNPMSVAKVRLGRYLFYDARISVNGTMSCSSCHRQKLAFADNRPRPVGATGQLLRHSAMSLVNVAYDSVLTWSRPGSRSLEDQVWVPLLTGEPSELGMGGGMAEFIQVLRTDSTYPRLFNEAFPDERDPFTILNVSKAIASFERSIVSARSPYDRYHYAGEANAISEAAKRGEVLFFSDPVAACYRCHGGFNFSDTVDYVGVPRGPFRSITTVSITCPGHCPIRRRAWGFTNSPGGRKTWASSRRRRCATSR